MKSIESLSSPSDDNDSLIRIPLKIEQGIDAMERVNDWFINELDREPSDEELAERLQISLRRVDNLKQARLRQYPVSLDMLIGDVATRGSVLRIRGSQNTEELVMEGFLKEQLIEFMEETLSQREQDILEMRFGLGDHSELTVEYIGKLYGITSSRVYQIIVDALTKLKEHGEAKKLHEYLD
jgi:RNA polymerase primary sigma factor